MFLEISTDKYNELFNYNGEKYCVLDVRSIGSSQTLGFLLRTNSRYELKIWMDLNGVEMETIPFDYRIGLWYNFRLKPKIKL